MTTLKYPPAPLPLITQRIEHQAHCRALHPAVVAEGRTLSYGGLASFMRLLASSLQQAGVSRNGRVGLLLDNGIESCASMCGVLRADACYVPLNIQFPEQRLNAVFDDADMDAVITLERYLPLLVGALNYSELPQISALIVLDQDVDKLRESDTYSVLEKSFATVFDRTAIENADDELAQSINTEEDLAYIMYTSGTTGRPKGVMVQHKAMNALIAWAVDHAELSAEDRVGNHSRISFDLSVFDIFPALAVGATVYPVTKPGDIFLPAHFIRDNDITVWLSVPSVIGALIKSRRLSEGAFGPKLRKLYFCGEALSPKFAAAVLETHPELDVFNIYGPTEATVACSCFQVGVDLPFSLDSPVPIGRPFPNMEAVVFHHDKDKPVESGQIGRLMMCGSQLASGYWRRQDLTDEAFRPNPLKAEFGARMYETGDLVTMDDDGIIHYVGRSDSQVKVQGYRIELGEIEVALCGDDNINAAAVVVLQGERPMIVAGVALIHEESLDDMRSRVLEHCSSLLPKYMVPERIKVFDELPHNANGKIDRAAVRDAFETAV